MTEHNFQAIVMAAGKGTRMKSNRAKVLHEILGRPIIHHVVDSALSAGAQRVVCILGYQREEVESYLREHFGDRVVFAVQNEQLGTGHAVYCAREFLIDAPGHTMILSGDVPNMDAATLLDFARSCSDEYLLVLMTAVLDDAATYGRIVRNDEGDVSSIVEFADADSYQREISEINAGFYVARTDFLREEIERLCSSEPDNAQGEYYLTDLVETAASAGRVRGWEVPENERIQGVNTRAHLAAATEFARRRLNEHWMTEGVTMIAPEQVFVDMDVELAPDVVLHPGVQLQGHTRVGAGTVIENSCVVSNTTLGSRVHLKPFCHLEDSQVDDEAQIGPMAHLRPGADIGKRCKVGNFVEVKKTRMDDGAKASHHAYLGDGHIGSGANIGAGTIFCNYDGENKHRTEIAEGVFIGSNTAIVAPVNIGRGAYVGAGSVITEDVPDESLAVARGRQRNIEGWVRRKKKED